MSRKGNFGGKSRHKSGGQRAAGRGFGGGNRTGGGRSDRRPRTPKAKTFLESGDTFIGTFRKTDTGGIIYPASKTQDRDSYVVTADKTMGAKTDDLVSASFMTRKGGKEYAEVTKVLGAKGEASLISLIVMHSQNIIPGFSPAALADVENAAVPPLGDRTDLTGLPLVTIDGIDARDFDDAVFAEPDNAPNNKGGWHLVVAIADVAHYVRRGSALDTEAMAKGNSTYFPDRVVPMLPEVLSNDLCSLRPKEVRATMAVHLWIDVNGKLIRHKFVRGLMKSRARLTYEQVQAAYDGQLDDVTTPLIDTVIKPLYGAYQTLAAARKKRGALELDLPERKVKLSEDGEIVNITRRERLDSHMLIEEFMVLSNVAAAMELEKNKAPCVYRIHPAPDPEKLEATREFLEDLGYSIASPTGIKASHINQILLRASGSESKDLVHTVILRTQSQAVYSPDNIGHFGLALSKYAHFTSPIRRYADLLVHRSLIRALNLGDDGLTDEETADLEQISVDISAAERRSMVAEREANDRYTALYLSDKAGVEFDARISSVQSFGLFITLSETGGDGIIPIRLLPDDYYIHDEQTHALIGRQTRRIYRMSAPMRVRLLEADPIKGSTVFEPADDLGAEIPGFSMKATLRRRNQQRTAAEDDRPRRDSRGSRRNEERDDRSGPARGRSRTGPRSDERATERPYGRNERSNSDHSHDERASRPFRGRDNDRSFDPKRRPKRDVPFPRERLDEDAPSYAKDRSDRTDSPGRGKPRFGENRRDSERSRNDHGARKPFKSRRDEGQQDDRRSARGDDSYGRRPRRDDQDAPPARNRFRSDDNRRPSGPRTRTDDDAPRTDTRKGGRFERKSPRDAKDDTRFSDRKPFKPRRDDRDDDSRPAHSRKPFGKPKSAAKPDKPAKAPHPDTLPKEKKPHRKGGLKKAPPRKLRNKNWMED